MAGPRGTRDPAESSTPASSPTSTIALETSDLASLELAEAGIAEVRPNATIALEQQDLVEVRPGQIGDVARTEPSVVIEPDPPSSAGGVASVFSIQDVEDLDVPRREHIARAPSQPPIRAARAVTAPNSELDVRPARSAGGAWLVAVVYLVATIALGLAIYERWFR